MEESLIQEIINAAVEVHSQLGPGLMENIYESALCHELSLRRMAFERQVPIQVMYKNAMVREPLFLDVIVENKIILELKAAAKEFPFFQVQLFTYLRLTGLKMGLLINFGRQNVRDGISRIVNDKFQMEALC